MVPLELVGVRVEVPANTPMLLLREATGRHRLMPIYIGTPEATAIHYALEGVESPRPLTHDLFVQTLAELGVALERVVVTEMRDHTYYAELHLRRPDSGLTVMSSRTSDAIALAVRCDAPMMANEELLDLVGQEPPAEPEEEAEEIIDEFREFIDQVNPDDFA
ncbi:bifunctional nuclease family protein [Desertimonas flava]|uniref:bifunctional nuclease family protein n=1 Tax=Desertimonas flava TaxID=2064846 RepID=UPI000E3430DF|nr:bifunctional nuclease family protein [Desertimonas flava]